MIGYALAFLAGIAFTVVVMLALSKDDPTHTRPEATHECRACGEGFTNLKRGYRHAQRDHGAPDSDAAGAIIEEVPDESE